MRDKLLEQNQVACLLDSLHHCQRVCIRGFSEGKSKASKQATNLGLAKTSNLFYTVLPNVFILLIFSFA